MSMKVTPQPAPVGRPRAFDTDAALEKAMQVFWQKGYEGASLSDLTEAMGINRPSLYAAFGNKEELFRKALDCYGEGPAAYVLEALKEPTAKAVIEKLITAGTTLLSDPRNPRGCLAVQAALCCGDEANSARLAARERRVMAQDKICERLERARSEGDLPVGVEPADLARHVAILMHGMSVQAVNGATRSELKKAADFAIKTLPF